MALSALDNFIIAAYIAVIIAIGVFFARRKSNNASDYFLASRSANWFVVGCSFFASNIGSDSIIGLSGVGAAYGVVGSFFDWGSAFFFLLLGWIFLPFFRKTGVFTLPQYLELRFNLSVRTYIAAVSLLGFVMVQYALTLYSATVVTSTVLDWEEWPALLAIVSVTTFYTFAGGLSAVVYTEVMQTFLLLLGSIITCAMAMARVGGLSGLFSSTQDKRNLHLLRSDSDTPYSLLGLLLGAPFLIGWYHCCNQDMVQRGLAAKDMEHAKGGCVMAGWLKLLPPFLFLLPGMAARLLFPQELQCHTTPSSSSCSNPDAAFPLLVHQLIPAGLRGLVLAAVLAAMMSTLASAFNSSSTLFTMDIYLRARPSASSHELVLVGKACTLLLAVLAVLWVPVIKRLRAAVYVYAQMANGCLSPPIFTLFCLSLSSSSLNSAGALAGLSLGHLLGFTRMAVCIAMGGCEASRSSSSLLERLFLGTEFLLFAFAQGVISGLVMVVVSWATGGAEQERVRGLTWSTREDSRVFDSVASSSRQLQGAAEMLEEDKQGETDEAPLVEHATSSSSSSSWTSCGRWAIRAGGCLLAVTALAIITTFR